MRRVSAFILAMIFTAASITSYATALPVDYMDSDIILYDPNYTDDTCSGESLIKLGTLPTATTNYLDGRNVTFLAEQNKAAYESAQAATGVPWQVLAALHYREAGMAPTQSLTNGAALGSGTNVDGLTVGNALGDDAVIAANHFITMAKSVYDIDPSHSENFTLQDWGNAFLAYNRGNMYKSWGATYDQSPYVMNGFDENHMNMNWIEADQSAKGGKKLNSLAGKPDGNKAGALAVMSYLGVQSLGAGCVYAGGGIVETALHLAHDTPVNNGVRLKSNAVQAYQEAQPQFNGSLTAGVCSEDQWSDCGVFVSTVMHMSGADTEFPKRGTANMMSYMKNSSRYEVIESPSIDQLQPGDILVYNVGKAGHIMIFTGLNGPNNEYVAVDASLCQRVPSVRTSGGVAYQLKQSGVIAGRLIK